MDISLLSQLDFLLFYNIHLFVQYIVLPPWHHGKIFFLPNPNKTRGAQVYIAGQDGGEIVRYLIWQDFSIEYQDNNL